MMNINHKKSGCGFSEQLISYLYDEISGAEKVVFETHLPTCSICSDELASFSGIHFAIDDWKSQELAGLATPRIEIPYPIAVKDVEVSGNKGSWWAELRKIFVLSPQWSLATATFAVLAIIGISFLVFSSPQSDELAARPNEPTKPVISPIAANTPPVTNPNPSETNPPAKQSKPVDAPKDIKPETAEAPNTSSNTTRVVKVVNNPRPTPKPENVKKTNDVKNPTKNDRVPPKVVVQDDDEDNTLRLAELFDEIDTK